MFRSARLSKSRRHCASACETWLTRFERRFRRLLSCTEAEDVLEQLRSWIRLAAGKGVGVNYESLLFDLLLWNKYTDDIRVKWAKSFWHTGETTEPQPIAVTP